MKYSTLVARLKKRRKDEHCAVTPEETVRDVVLQCVCETGRLWPEAVMDSRGGRRSLPDPEDFPEEELQEEIPIAAEFEPGLFAACMAALHEGDAEDAKDEALARYWISRKRELLGA